jgi:predicted metal-dependent hydrolase
MRAISNIMWSSAKSEAALEAALPVPVDIVPMRNARRLRLRFDEANRKFKLTCPARTSRKAALAWALDQRLWIEQQLARAGTPEPFSPGAIIPIEGEATLIMWDEKARRSPFLIGGELRCGGPVEGLPRRIETFLKRRALVTMSLEAAGYATAAGVTIRSLSVGDAGSRWGSCSSQGRIRLSWRLILAPPDVRRYVVAHEVAHLVHLNHGSEFKALEARLFGPGLSEAKAKLKRLGPRLRLIGRGH